MDLIFQPRTTEELSSLVIRSVARHPDAERSLEDATDIAVFGSIARGVDGPSSDLDILAVGTGERLKTKYIDLIFVPPSRLSERWWLSGELARHVAKYGVWIKGALGWDCERARSRWPQRKKAIRIIQRLSNPYVHGSVIKSHYVSSYIETAVLDMLRLDRLTSGEVIPTTAELKASAIEQGFQVLDRLPAMLGGEAVQLMMQSIMSVHVKKSIREGVEALFTEQWATRLISDQAWRLSGRPQT
ncbi:MAG: nucleotidyltransferase domain-containing protein [Nannocystaceae bacterium]